MLPGTLIGIWIDHATATSGGLLFSIANWMQNTWLGMSVATSDWAYPFVQMTHFTGLSIWLGTTFVVDLHLLGVVKRQQTTAELSKALIVWNWIGFVILVTGGLTLFSTAATTFILNPAFRTKLGLLVPAALTWHIILQIKIPSWGQTMNPPTVAKVAGAVEMFLWLCVATAATTIPYF